MTGRRWSVTVIALAAVMLAACSSSDDSPTCEYDGQTVLSRTAAWPKFRRDLGNTGQAAAAIGDQPSIRWVFPDPIAQPSLHDVGPIVGSPVVGRTGQVDQVLFVARSTDPNAHDVLLYVLNAADQPPAPNAITVTSGQSSTNTPLLGDDGTVYVASGDGFLRRFKLDGTVQSSVSLNGYLAGSPTIGSDGAVYVANLAGSFASVCPNGVPRFVIGMTTTQSSPAITANETIIIAGNDGGIRAYDASGRQLWSSYASAAVVASVALDETDPSASAHRFYAADISGRVFALSLQDGHALWPAPFRAAGGISASPAPGRMALYAADEAGTLYALDPASGEEQWRFNGYSCDSSTADVVQDPRGPIVQTNCRPCTAQTPECTPIPVGPIHSSPAVARSGDLDVVVFGADDGMLYAIGNAGTAPEVKWVIDLQDGAIGQSSVAFDAQGGFFIGTAGGHLFAIDAVPQATPPPTALPTPTVTPQ